MVSPRKQIVLNGATSQYDRWLADGETPRVDARTVTELLNFAVQFGALVRFYDLGNRPDGDWTNFFLTDPTMVLASIAAVDLGEIERRARKSIVAAAGPHPEAEKLRQLRDCLLYVLGLARRLDAWLTGVQFNPHSRSARLLVTEISAWIDSSLKHQLAQLALVAQDLISSGETDTTFCPDFGGFHKLWSTEQITGATLQGGYTRTLRLDGVATALEAIVATFIQAIHQIRKLALKYLPETLEESSHKPQIALYIAYVQLFGTAQQTINTLSDRFRRFYYNDVLRATKTGPVPDSVYLTLTLDPATGVPEASVPGGTLFAAGKEPDGSAILYAADREVSVTGATLSVVRGMRLVKGPLYSAIPDSPDCGWWPAGYESPASIPVAIQSVMGTTINVPVMNDEAAGKGPQGGLVPWPVFGATVAGSGDIAITSPVTLGFAVSSDYLMLTGGERTIVLTFPMAEAAEALKGDLASLAEVTGLDAVTVFEQVTGQAFEVWLSTTNGWFQLESYGCTAIPAEAESPTRFSMSFALAPTAPPLVAFDPSGMVPPPKPTGPDEINPCPSRPTLKAYLRNAAARVTGPLGEVSTWPLSVLSRIRIQGVSIHTSTIGLENLEVEITTGMVDTSSPFPVFGSSPVPGSFLEFRNRELFVKTPDSGSLRVNLEWFGLPQNDTGFLGYYQGYVIGLNGEPAPGVMFTNQSFQGELRVVNPGLWQFGSMSSGGQQSPPDGTEVFLFRTEPNCSDPVPTAGGSICALTDFDNLQTEDRVPPEYYDPNASAIQFRLTQPPYGFGSSLYAANVMNATIAALPKTIADVPEFAACQPLSDAANSLKTCCLSSDNSQPPLPEAIEACVGQTQDSLTEAALVYLLKSLAGSSDEVTANVRAAFEMSGTPSPGYRGQIARNRLMEALELTDASGFSSPPGWPENAAEFIRNAIRMLDGVVWMEQAMNHCAAEEGSGLITCLQKQLGACERRLRQAGQECTEAAQNSSKVPYPNAPWVPVAKTLSITYSAHCGTTDVSFFYLLPFSGYEAAPAVWFTLPILAIPEPGSLELGFSSLTVAQTISMLVQMCAGSEAKPPGLDWQYLTSTSDSGSRWMSFDEAQIPLDTTNCLQNTGLITVNVPDDTQGSQTALAGNYRWLRAVTTAPDRFPDAIGIYLHPLTATWVNDGTGSGQHLAQPLPPYTISGSVAPLPGIKSVFQPIESFGGRAAQDEKTFQSTLAERLRHKDRAILTWDYERLVLEQFPTIWKVQALPARNANRGNAAGHVLVVVVAGSQGVQAANPTEPLVSAEMLEQIRKYLAERASPFAHIQVVNPGYVRIRVTATAIFQESDGGGGTDRLNADLTAYLSPWFYDVARATTRGTYANEDAISHFVQMRPYVAALIEIGYDYDPPPETLEWYFLTSAETHSITGVDRPPEGDQPCFP